jgi:hypothetical protein
MAFLIKEGITGNNGDLENLTPNNNRKANAFLHLIYKKGPLIYNNQGFLGPLNLKIGVYI